CWCSSNDPRRLRQLKDACRACYDYATTFKTPFISGKDSMFNDFKGYDNDSNPLKISVYPTLLISAIGVIEDVRQTNTIDLKLTGDLIYVIGNTMDECGASDFYHAYSKI
ncbi:phosphoribosylformylglycinamidine synthase, partial [Candidatus Woesearchaeota archaeon CG08_land_8_20_14_0_20_47_9]